MAISEERQKILEMVAGGKLSAQEAADLLNAGAPESAEAAPEPAAPEPAAPEAPQPPQAPVAGTPAEEAGHMPAPAKAKEEVAASAPGWLRVRIDDVKSGRSKVSVNIPLSLMKAGLQLGRSFAPELRDVDWDRFSNTLTEDGGGLLVEVQDEEEGEHVRIFIE